MKRKPHKPHWYKQYLGECPVCGKDQSYKVRVYGEKPTNPGEIYEYLSDYATYDHCMR